MPYLDSPFRIISENFSTYFWQHHDFINLLRHAYCVQFAVRSHMPSLFSADQIQTFAFLYELKSDRGFEVSIWSLLILRKHDATILDFSELDIKVQKCSLSNCQELNFAQMSFQRSFAWNNQILEIYRTIWSLKSCWQF